MDRFVLLTEQAIDFLELGDTGAQNNYDTLTNCNKVENDIIWKHIVGNYKTEEKMNFHLPFSELLAERYGQLCLNGPNRPYRLASNSEKGRWKFIFSSVL